MWGDLRGGKKSIDELQKVPQEITVTLSNPGLALKRQQTWEQVKESAAQNVSLCVSVESLMIVAGWLGCNQRLSLCFSLPPSLPLSPSLPPSLSLSTSR